MSQFHDSLYGRMPFQHKKAALLVRLIFLTFGCWQQIERLAVCHWTGQNYPSRFTMLVFLENNVKMRVPGSSRTSFTSFKKLSLKQMAAGFSGTQKFGSLQLDPLDPTCSAHLPWNCHGKPTNPTAPLGVRGPTRSKNRALQHWSDAPGG